MARKSRKPNATIEELISAKEQEISSLTEKLKDAKAALKSLQDEKLLDDSRRIMEAIVASGKSVEDVLSLLNK